jgi:hypothetical protein
MSSNGQKLVNFYPNDPSASDVPLEQVPYMTLNKLEVDGIKWKIQGDVPDIGLYKPGTSEFQFCQINSTLYRCIKLWKNVFQEAFKSWSSTESLTVIPELDYRTVPRAEDGFNAFYDRDNLAFFYDSDNITQKQVYTCESVDVVAHECGHGCLDAVQPDFWDAILPEIPAFHEAFGDCSAILTTLTDNSVRKAFLKTHDPLKESNLVSRLAEQLGHGIFSRYGRDRSDEKSLRDAINDYKYKNPTTLPDEGPDTVLTKEGHSFARVFGGAFYGSLVRIYQLLAQEIPDKDQALTQAADSMGRVFGEGVLSTSVTPVLYREIALGMLKADDRLFRGKYRQAIIDAFVEKNILSSVAATSLKKNIELHSATGSAKSLSDIKIPENTNELRSEKFVEGMKDFLGISDTTKLDMDVKEGLRSNSLIVKGRYDPFKKLKTGGGDLPGEIEAYIPSGFAIIIDTKSKSLVSHAHVTDSNAIEEAQNYFQYLRKADKIYVPKGEEKVNKTKLAALHKPYYISEGKKLLRSYFA